MTLQYVRNRIIELMGRWVASLKGSASMSQTDLNIVSEYVAMQLLREVYGWSDLRNLNTESANYPGVDLADDNARVAIQITSKTTLDKVRHTLSEFVNDKRKLYERYDRLIIYMLVEKQRSYGDKGLTEIINNHFASQEKRDTIDRRFTFDKDRDILDYRDLLAAVQDFPIERAQRVLAILEANFGDNTQAVSTPVHTIEPFNLPRDPGCFGRGVWIAQIEEQLCRQDAVPIVSIHGMGGLGKTTLGLHVAHELIDPARQGRFKDAQLYIDLSGTDPVPMDPIDALTTLLNFIRGPDPSRPRDLAVLASLWRQAVSGKDALLFLDNAYSAEQVRPLLPDSRTCAVLITSDRRFDLDLMAEELRLDLDPMPLEEARGLLQVLAPRLHADAADRIAAECGCLPLALRTAGSYLKLNEDIPVDDYIAGLAEKRTQQAQRRKPGDPYFDFFAIISLSVDRLDADLRRSWALLSLFPAPFDRAAAAALWWEPQELVPLDFTGMDEAGLQDWLRRFLEQRPELVDGPLALGAFDEYLDKAETSDRLGDLRNRSLLSYDGTAGRYFQHDLVRLAAAKALEELDDDDVEVTRKRLARYHLDICRAAKNLYNRGGEDLLKGLALFDREWPHIQAGQAWAASRAEEDREAARLCNDYPDAASDLLLLRLRPGTYVAWLEAGLHAARRLGDQQGEANHLGGLAVAYRKQGKLDLAEEVCRQALEIVPEEDRRNKGRLLNSLGNINVERGELAEAIGYFRQALEIETENRKARLVPLGSLGIAYRRLGELGRAARYYTEALEIARETRDWQLEALTLGNLGDLYVALGEPNMAIKLLNEALQLERPIDDPSTRAAWLASLGCIHRDQGDITEARDCWTQALDVLEATGDPVAENIRLLLSMLAD